MEEIKSLSALLFFNLTEILNGDKENKEEIIKNVQNKLQATIDRLLEEIICSIKEETSKDVNLTGYYKVFNKINTKSDLFDIIESLEKLKTIIENRDFLLPQKNKKELMQLKKDIIANDYVKGVSRAQIYNFKNYTKPNKFFKKKVVDYLVQYVLIPTMIENDKCEDVMQFLVHTDNYVQITNKNVQYYYEDNGLLIKSINKLIDDYQRVNKELTGSMIRKDTSSFQEFLKSLFFQLDESSTKKNSTADIQYDDYDFRSDIYNYISEKLGNMIGIETTGITEDEHNNMRMQIAQRIEADYHFFNEELLFSWKECNLHQGFRALQYYRIYKMLCNYEGNEALNSRGRELIEECWQETSIYISPDSDVVAPVYIGKDCIITSACKVEKKVIIGSGTKLISSRVTKTLEKRHASSIDIKRNTLIMQNVLIYDKARIGEYCVITPGSVISFLEKDYSKGKPNSNMKKQEYNDYILELREEERKCIRI